MPGLSRIRALAGTSVPLTERKLYLEVVSLAERVYCPNCRELVETKVESRVETYPVKGEDIPVSATVRVCEACGEDIFDENLDERTLALAYEEYRKRKGLLTPQEIRSIRESFGLSQRGLAELLNWGEVTIHRYENGAVQDEAHNSVLLALRDNPQFVLNLLARNGGRLAPREVERVRQRVFELLQVSDETGDGVVRWVVLPKWLSDLAEEKKLNLSQVLQHALRERLGTS